MTESSKTQTKPLWFFMEEKFLDCNLKELSGFGKEKEIKKIATELDATGYNVSLHGGNMIQLRWAIEKMLSVGRPFMKDFNAAIDALTLEQVADPFSAMSKLVTELGKTWDDIKKDDRREEVLRIVRKTKLDLTVKKAKELPGDKSIRFLITEKIAPDVIISELEITRERLAEVNALIAAEEAERNRVKELLDEVKDKTDDEKIKHLINKNVTDELIIEVGKFDQKAIDKTKKSMEEEIKEKQRLAEEEAERKRKESEGPSLENIPADEMLDYIEAIREILEFSDKEKEIRVMCEQSAIPKALVDIAVSDPDKLDQLEADAEG